MSNHRINLPPHLEKAVPGTLLSVIQAKYEQDWSDVPEAGAFTTLFYITGGEGTFFADGERFPVKEDDLILLNPDVCHAENSRLKCPLTYLSLEVEELSFSFEEGCGYAVCHFREHRDVLRPILQEIAREAQEHAFGCETVCQNLLELLLIRILRYAGHTFCIASTRRTGRDCKAVKDYIDKHYKSSISLDSLSALFRINKYYLVHTFTKAIGASPINYLIMKRVEESKGLLTGTAYSISRVANMIGFTSQSYFSQAFKKSVGMTPIEYRKKGNQPC